MMGLTNTSMGTKLLEKNNNKVNFDYTVAIAGNPNVGKSTIFNSLTGLHQHTGNWPGKTVANAKGLCNFNKKNFLLVDIPGTYSIMSHSEEEEIARDYMEITPNVIVCINLLDEAKKKGIKIDLDALQNLLGVPVVGTIARKPKTLQKLLKTIHDVCTGEIKVFPKQVKYSPIIEDSINLLIPELKEDYISRWIALKILDGDEKILKSIQSKFNINLDSDNIIRKRIQIQNMLENNNINTYNIKDTIISHIVFRAETIAKDVCSYDNENYSLKQRKIDKILTSKKFGIPIMLIFLGVILWITIVGANYPSSLLTRFFWMVR